jgi:hypothetical protein
MRVHHPVEDQHKYVENMLILCGVVIAGIDVLSGKLILRWRSIIQHQIMM